SRCRPPTATTPRPGPGARVPPQWARSGSYPARGTLRRGDRCGPATSPRTPVASANRPAGRRGRFGSRLRSSRQSSTGQQWGAARGGKLRERKRGRVLDFAPRRVVAPVVARRERPGLAREFDPVEPVPRQLPVLATVPQAGNVGAHDPVPTIAGALPERPQ